jgi:hypothetical protein
MIPLESRIQVIKRFGDAIALKLESYKSGREEELERIIASARVENPWFTSENICSALDKWSLALYPENVDRWIEPYLPALKAQRNAIVVGVINAGNIPFVGLHDLLTVILCGCKYVGKNATGDKILLPYLSRILGAIEPEINNSVRFVERIADIDAVIATGSNNSARYFEYYFGKYPHIIRKNRNGVGVLTGKEKKNQLHELGKDIFSYFGLGCRNVSKLYVPAGYDFKEFFESIYDFNSIMMHSNYMNNFDYNNTLLLLKRIPFLQNGFLILREEKLIPSPISVLHFEEYTDQKSLSEDLISNINLLQCIACDKNIVDNNDTLKKIQVDFGKTQSPALWEYADGVNTLEFIVSSQAL